MAAGQHDAERLHAAEDEHDGARTDGGVDQNLRQVLPLEGLIDIADAIAPLSVGVKMPL